MSRSTHWLRVAGTCAVTLAVAASVQAAQRRVTVTVENLAPANSIGVAPLHFGFHGGSLFDAFDIGSVATAPIMRVAEVGSGSTWQPAFAAADPGATRGTVPGEHFSGGKASLEVIVDTMLNPYFTFAAMVVPSNDFFIGNDAPDRYRVFDAAGKLAIRSIGQKARDIWDAGSEVFDPAAAALVGNAGMRSNQNSVVALNFAELAAFNGMTTAAGYTFNSGLAADTNVYRISFASRRIATSTGFAATAVPEPQTWALMIGGLALVGCLARRRVPGRDGQAPDTRAGRCA